MKRLGALLVVSLPAALSASLAAQTTGNVAELTVQGGRDAGHWTLTGGARSCVLKPRPDGQPGFSFVGNFDGGSKAKGAPQETSTAFYAGADGSAKEVNVVVSFPDEEAFELRPYQVETRARSGLKPHGKGSARLTRAGGGATVQVDGTTDEGVKLSLVIRCAAV